MKLTSTVVLSPGSRVAAPCKRGVVVAVGADAVDRDGGVAGIAEVGERDGSLGGAAGLLLAKVDRARAGAKVIGLRFGRQHLDGGNLGVIRDGRS
ncbi:MAG: hypothetical protein U5K81_08080 [Trueperaceae bacterium]|nr:hypothetical protein [Trueperaceae bacterium]